MRLREFAKIKEAPIGTTGALGGALATGIGKFTGLTIDYIRKYFKWRAERNAGKKKQKEKDLKKSAKNMNPKEKKDAKTAVSDPKIISKFTPKAKPVIGTTAVGSDMVQYTWGGRMWLDTSKTNDLRKAPPAPKDQQKYLTAQLK